MEWAIGIPILLLVLMILICPLMMLGMAVMSVGMVRGWLRGRSGESDHGGHGMMMCMGHGQHGSDSPNQQTGEPTDQGLIEELKAERQRLEELIARADRGGAR